MFKSAGFKKWTAKLLTVFMTASLLLSGYTPKVYADTGKVFNLIEITDFHGTLLDSSNNEVAAVLAQDIKDEVAKNPDRTLILGGGDLYQGSPLSNYFKGVPVQKALSEMGMEVTALGNHEFDWGLSTITETTMKDAKYSIVCANLYKDGKRVFDPYKIITKDGERIAVIGAISEETPSIVTPNNVKDFEFKDMATEVNAVAKDIKDNNKADVIIALVHEGSNKDLKTGPVFDFAAKLLNVSAVFGGHSHTIVNGKASNDIPVYIANNAGRGFINATMTVAADKSVSFTGNYIALDDNATNPIGYKNPNAKKDAKVKAIVDAANNEAGPFFNEVIGTTLVTLTRTQLAAPYGESYLGNWITDAIRKSANCEVGFQNNGGIRVDVQKGNITIGTMNFIMPFDNTIVKLQMTKAQLKAVFETAFADNGKGIQVSGLKVTYDSTKPSGNRVIDIVRANGKSISDAEKLTTAVPDFLATGGDGFTPFIGAGGADPKNDTHVLIRDAMIADAKANKGIVAKTTGRITNVASTISIVGTSDLHGNIYPYDYATDLAADQGLARVSSYVKNLRAANPNTILVDAGDTIQGTALSYYYDKIDTKTAYPMMQVMGKMGYSTWTLGNHEFNYGLETLNRIIADAKKNNIEVISGNIYNKADGKTYVKPYTMKSFNLNGKTQKIAILGLTTKTIPNWENASNYEGLVFKDIVEEGNYWAAEAKKAGADKIVAVVHSGEEGATDAIPENQVKALAAGSSSIDAIICGHAHSIIDQHNFINKDGKTVLVTEPGKWGQYVSQIDIAVDASGNIMGLTTNTIKMDTVVADQEIIDLAKPFHEKTLEYINTVIGNTTGEFSGKDQTMKNTALMDLINEIQRKAAGTQLSIAAPLSNTAYIPKGEVKIKDMMSVYVFENFLYGVKMNGAQIKKWMEYSVKYYKQFVDGDTTAQKDAKLNVPDYNLDFLYGATYDVDLTQPVGSRIKNLKYNGVTIKDTDVFTVAINNYRFNGGGGFMKEAGLLGTDGVYNGEVVYDSMKALGDDGQVRNLMIDYFMDNKDIKPVASNNWMLYTSAVTEIPAYSNGDSNLIEVIEKAPEGSTVIVKLEDNTKAAAAIFNSIKGKDVNVVFEGENITWTFNGKDIKGTLSSPIDLSLIPASTELGKKIGDKVKSITGKDTKVFAFSLKHDGELPGSASVKILIGTEWAGKTINLYQYLSDKNTYSLVQGNILVDAEGYAAFTLTHCSDYFVTEASANLPKTGSMVDYNFVLTFGFILAGLGTVVLMGEERRRSA